jgi:hypothetical protein
MTYVILFIILRAFCIVVLRMLMTASKLLQHDIDSVQNRYSDNGTKINLGKTIITIFYSLTNSIYFNYKL